MRVIIIGGGTAGSEVAWRLRQQNKDLEIIIIEKGKYTQYSPCALPYFISGKIKKVEEILLFDKNFYDYNKVDLKLKAEVVNINSDKKEVEYIQRGKKEALSYDYLVLANGLKFVAPGIKGLDKCSFYKLKNIDDAIKIKEEVKEGDRAVIVGAGYVGVELSEALSSLGLKVSLLESQERILSGMFDKKISAKITSSIEEEGVEIITGLEIKEINKKEIIFDNKKINYDKLFLACGSGLDLSLAKQAGIDCDKGVLVDEHNKTSDPSIFAVGDIVESVNFIDNKKKLSQLATTAVAQAKIVAGNILGNKESREKVLSTNISRFDGLIFGSCGLTNEYCQANNIEVVPAFYSGQDKAEYYPEAQDTFIYLIADLKDKKIVGCQIAGYNDVAGRLNMVSLAIKNNLSLEQFIKTETCYNPSAAPIFDPLILAAEICLKKNKS